MDLALLGISPWGLAVALLLARRSLQRSRPTSSASDQVQRTMQRATWMLLAALVLGFVIVAALDVATVVGDVRGLTPPEKSAQLSETISESMNRVFPFGIVLGVVVFLGQMAQTVVVLARR
jgi:hypothetical protein